jgi:hypothetical protein
MFGGTSWGNRNLWLQIALAIVGTTAYCCYARSWRSATHLLYDIPANLAVFSFIAQVLLEFIQQDLNRTTCSRLALLAAMTVVSAGRDFCKWNISGHLSCVLAVALVQTADPRLTAAHKLFYWLPLPIVLGIRWWIFDQGNHDQTYHALIFAVAAGLPVALVTAMTACR